MSGRARHPSGRPLKPERIERPSMAPDRRTEHLCPRLNLTPVDTFAMGFIDPRDDDHDFWLKTKTRRR